MPFSNYSELKDSISDWMVRNDVAGSAADFITLAEARLNRIIGSIGISTTLQGVEGSRFIDLSSLNMDSPTSLYMMVNDREMFVSPAALGTFYEQNTPSIPSNWAVDSDNRIRFDCPLSGPYEARFTYQGRFGLSDAIPTNDLLTNQPDVYLAASIVWGNVYIQSNADVALWKTMLDEFVAETQSEIAQSQRGVLMTDPLMPKRRQYNYDRDIVT